MSPISWLDSIAYGISVMIATALALIVLGAGPRRTLNRFFALFTLAEATWAALALLLQMTLWLGVGNPAFVLEMGTLAFTLMGPFLLLSTVRYVGRRTRQADLAAVIELVVTIAFVVPLFRHQLIFNPRLGANGTTFFDVSTWGVAAAVLPALCFIWSLVLFWQERRRTGEPYLALSVLILLIGFVVGGIVQLRFPIISITTIFSIATLGYGVVSRQIFNPLREQTIKLKQEIAERKRTEDALRAAQEYTKNIIASSLDMIITVDMERRIVEFNTAAQKAFGYSRNKVLGTHVDILYADSRDGLVIHQTALEKGQCTRQVLDKRQNGELFPSLLAASVLRDAHGELVGVMGISRDITERKRVEKALQESEARYRTLVTQSPIGVITCDRAGNITHANPALLQILGSPGEEATRQFNLLTMPNLVEAGVAADFYRCMEEVTQIAAEYPYRSYWGKESVMRVRLTPLRDEGGAVNGALATVEDVTEQRQLQEQLIQSAKLASIGQLAAGVAHEINNPLNGIINYAQLLLNKAESGSREARFMEGILREGDRVTNIVRDLLTFARVEKEAHSLARVPDILRATLTLTDQQLRKDSIILEIEKRPDLPWIKCRSQRIQQVFLNLISNARHALNARYPKDDPNKRLTIRIEVVEKEEQPYVRTTFHDLGVGIPAQNLPHVFTPFFTTKKPGNGTGLGLSVSYGIVQNHHGDIQVESVEGEYTIFRVDLPVDNGWEL